MLCHIRWIILALSHMCLVRYTPCVIQCTEIAPSNDAFPPQDEECTKFTATLTDTPTPDGAQASDALSEIQHSQRIPSALRAFPSPTITHAMRLERSPVSVVTWQGPGQLKLESTFVHHAEFDGLQARTFLHVDHAAANGSGADRAGDSSKNEVRKRTVQYFLIYRDRGTFTHGNKTNGTRNTSSTVYFGAYDIPNNFWSILLELKRSGLLSRVKTFANMYQQTKSTTDEEFVAQPLISWFDVLDADALARVDAAVETLSVEYELWTHLYDLSDAPPHLDYTSINKCAPLLDDVQSNSCFKGMPSPHYICRVQWLTCPTPHPDYVSIVFAEKEDMFGKFFELKRVVDLSQSSVRFLPNMRIEAGDEPSLPIGNHKLVLIFSGTIVHLEPIEKKFWRSVLFNISMETKNELGVTDLTHVILNAILDDDNHFRHVRCSKGYPMACHFLFVHEMRLSTNLTGKEATGRVIFWGTAYRDQLIRNASVTIVPLSPGEYDAVVQRRIVLHSHEVLSRGITFRALLTATQNVWPPTCKPILIRWQPRIRRPVRLLHLDTRASDEHNAAIRPHPSLVGPSLLGCFFGVVLSVGVLMLWLLSVRHLNHPLFVYCSRSWGVVQPYLRSPKRKHNRTERISDCEMFMSSSYDAVHVPASPVAAPHQRDGHGPSGTIDVDFL